MNLRVCLKCGLFQEVHEGAFSIDVIKTHGTVDDPKELAEAWIRQFKKYEDVYYEKHEQNSKIHLTWQEALQLSTPKVNLE